MSEEMEGVVTPQAFGYRRRKEAEEEKKDETPKALKGKQENNNMETR